MLLVFILLSFVLLPLSSTLYLLLSTIVPRNLDRTLTLNLSFGLGTVSKEVTRTSTVEAAVCVTRTSGLVVYLRATLLAYLLNHLRV